MIEKRGRWYARNSNGLVVSDEGISGISTLEKARSGFPSRAQRALRRMESLSPRLILSSECAGGSSGRETPINSADSRRVETDERRWWCEAGRAERDAFGIKAGDSVAGEGREMELFRERDRP